MSDTDLNQKGPVLCLNLEYSPVEPAFTIVLTTFNQELLIERVIHSIIQCSILPSELIIIDDKSEDETLNKILDLMSNENWNHGSVSKASLYFNKSSCFETFCDDFGIRAAKTNHVVLVQSDVIITEKRFDVTLTACLGYFPDIMMISARGTEPIQPIANSFQTSNGSVVDLGFLTLLMTQKNIHKSFQWLISLICGLSYYVESKIAWMKRMTQPASFFEQNQNLCNDAERPLLADFIHTGKAGYLSTYEITKESGFGSSGTVWLGQTVMRGPIAIDRSKYLEVGGFDVGSCFLGFDDHEIALRAYLSFQYRVGFLPIGFRSSLEWGATRRKRSFKQTRMAILNCLRVANKRRMTALYRVNDESSNTLPVPEIREFPL